MISATESVLIDANYTTPTSLHGQQQSLVTPRAPCHSLIRRIPQRQELKWTVKSMAAASTARTS
jgi:hypothetical protein